MTFQERGSRLRWVVLASTCIAGAGCGSQKEEDFGAAGLEQEQREISQISACDGLQPGVPGTPSSFELAYDRQLETPLPGESDGTGNVALSVGVQGPGKTITRF